MKVCNCTIRYEECCGRDEILGLGDRFKNDSSVDTTYKCKPSKHLDGMFGDILGSLNDLLEYKNTKYGDAVLNPLEIFCGKCKAGQRLDDKLGRIKNSKELRKNDVADLIGYLVLTCKEKGWDNFDEFKD